MKTRSQTASARLAASQRCRLLELPAELRNDIYERSLNVPELDDFEGFKRPGLLSTRKEIRTDMLRMYGHHLEVALEAGRKTFRSRSKGKKYKAAAASIMGPPSDWTRLQWQYEDFKKVVEEEIYWVEEELEKE